MFQLQFDVTNAAFEDGEDGRLESARILREIAEKLEQGSSIDGPIRDSNGNRVGFWSI